MTTSCGHPCPFLLLPRGAQQMENSTSGVFSVHGLPEIFCQKYAAGRDLSHHISQNVQTLNISKERVLSNLHLYFPSPKAPVSSPLLPTISPAPLPILQPAPFFLLPAFQSPGIPHLLVPSSWPVPSNSFVRISYFLSASAFPAFEASHLSHGSTPSQSASQVSFSQPLLTPGDDITANHIRIRTTANTASQESFDSAGQSWVFLYYLFI